MQAAAANSVMQKQMAEEAAADMTANYNSTVDALVISEAKVDHLMVRWPIRCRLVVHALASCFDVTCAGPALCV